ncbi:MAG: T9SS type A sorting domain-containing protein [Bacteroidetes bacterium]|nr:T9SS type A sorting domain-containing protein [Bacteroidota bacterium]
MKTICIIFSALIFAGSVYSQVYYPTVGEDKTWSVLAVVSCVPFDTSYSTISYQMAGDTIFSSGTYKKMYTSQGQTPGNWNLFCYMREDASRRVWYKHSGTENDRLMYDYSVHAGDSVLAGMEPVYLYVDSVTQVTIDGSARQKFWLSCQVFPDYKETWIEGIGSSRGIIFSGSAMLVGGWYWFLCISESGQLTYMNPAYNSCDLISGIPAEKNNSSVVVFPNPAHSRLNLEVPGSVKPGSICLSSVSGAFSREFPPESASLDIGEFPAGVYILRLEFAHGGIIKKIVID